MKDCAMECIKVHLDGKTIQAGICAEASGCFPKVSVADAQL
jgi:hypothetical protein